MKLHLSAEDINLYLQDQSIRAAQRIPLAARELARIQEDIQSVRNAVSSTLSKLDENDISGTVSSALATIAELDAVKSRMDSACTTLKEATGLSTLFHLVDDLFKAGDLTRIADALAGIRRGLSIVADTVPEFRNGKARLKALEDRLAAATEKPLIDALRAQRSDEAAGLSNILSSIARKDVVSRAYVTSRSRPMHALWEGYKPGTPFSSWMGSFYDQLLRTIIAEWDWCQATLPDGCPEMVLAASESFFEAIDKPFRARLAGALTGAPGSILPLEHLEHTAKAAETFLNEFRSECLSRNAVPETITRLLQRIAAPVEGALGQYPEKELQYLMAEIQSILSKAKERAAPPLDQTLSIIYLESLGTAFTCFSAALDRCIRVTQGTLLPPFVRSIDRALYLYITAMHTAILDAYSSSSSHTAASPTAASPRSRVPKAAVNIESAAPLLMLSSKLSKRVISIAMAIYRAVDVMLNEAALQEQSRILLSTGQTPLPSNGMDSSPAIITFANLRLHHQPALKQQLAAFYSTAVQPSTAIEQSQPDPDPRLLMDIILPQCMHALKDCMRSIETLVESSMSQRIKPHLYGLAELAEWTTQPSTAVSLPSFTPYPLQYITATGENLMLLPQVLESALTSAMMSMNADGGIGGGTSRQSSASVQGTDSLVQGGSPRSRHDSKAGGGDAGDDESDEAAQLVGEWVDRIALSTATTYQNQLSKIQRVSEQGALQLVADIEYFCNVLSTLGLSAPPVLATWQAALLAQDASGLRNVAELLRGDGSDAGESRQAVEMVAKLKGIAL